MGVENSNVIDLVSIDPLTGTVFLSLVEERPWGDRGELLRELETKLNTYIEYVEGGQLVHDYPDLVGKPVAFRLHYFHEPGANEREFIRIAVQQYLHPRSIRWEQSLLSAEYAVRPN